MAEVANPTQAQPAEIRGNGLKALCWHGKGDMRCETVPDPKIQHPRDAIIKVTACAICGSDLHIYDGVIPTMEKGDVLGHETMGCLLYTSPSPRDPKTSRMPSSA